MATVRTFLALPAEPDLSRVRSVLPARTSVLDLGSGPGRIANPLSATGHDVVAVDDSRAMLEHVVGAETVIGDVWALRLNRRFGAVAIRLHDLMSFDDCSFARSSPTPCGPVMVPKVHGRDCRR